MDPESSDELALSEFTIVAPASCAYSQNVVFVLARRGYGGDELVTDRQLAIIFPSLTLSGDQLITILGQRRLLVLVIEGEFINLL
jgi:hypothetical protein